MRSAIKTEEERKIVREARLHRPLCRNCGNPMEPHYRNVYVKGRIVGHIVGIRGYGYSSEGVFCSLRCGYRWAVRALEGG